jgi:plasmid stabilization system protein ParE
MSENDLYNVVVSQFAKEDLNEIIAYYESLNKSYIESVITQFENNIFSLSHFPESGRIIPELYKQGIERYREIIQGLYRIVYEVREKDVVIHTIIDSRRNFDEVLIAKLMRYIKK